MEGHYSQGYRVYESARRLFCMLRPCQDMQVYHNSARLISPPTMSDTFTISPYEIAQQMHTSRMPCQGLHILVLPATTKSRKQCFDLLSQISSLHTDLKSDAANAHKGKIGKVLDIGINQMTASGLIVCVCLKQGYSAVDIYRNI